MECTGVYQRALTETDFTFEVQCGVCFCAISLLTLALGLCRVCCSGCCLGQADMELLTQHLDPELRLKSRPKRHCVYVSDPWSPAFTEVDTTVYHAPCTTYHTSCPSHLPPFPSPTPQPCPYTCIRRRKQFPQIRTL